MKPSSAPSRPAQSRGATVLKTPGSKATVFKSQTRPPITSNKGSGKK